jgi:hypothetical protein
MTKYEAARHLSDIWSRHSCERKSCLNEPRGTEKRDYMSDILRRDLIALELAIELLDSARSERIRQDKAKERKQRPVRPQIRRAR